MVTYGTHQATAQDADQSPDPTVYTASMKCVAVTGWHVAVKVQINLWTNICFTIPN